MHDQDEVTLGDIPIEDESGEVHAASSSAQFTPPLGIRFSQKAQMYTMVFFLPFETWRYIPSFCIVEVFRETTFFLYELHLSRVAAGSALFLLSAHVVVTDHRFILQTTRAREMRHRRQRHMTRPVQVLFVWARGTV